MATKYKLWLVESATKDKSYVFDDARLHVYIAYCMHMHMSFGEVMALDEDATVDLLPDAILKWID